MNRFQVKTHRECLLNKSIASATSSFIFLKLNKFKFAKRLENILEIGFSDTEMNITNIQPVKRRRGRLPSAGFGIASLSILLRFGQLGNNRNS